jgi:hypothetical protein
MNFLQGLFHLSINLNEMMIGWNYLCTYARYGRDVR